MLTLLSPAKNMNFDPVLRDLPATTPALIEETRILSAHTRALTTSKIKSLMGISADLAKLNRERFQAFDAEKPGEKQAALAFNGEVYRGLDADSMSDEDLAYAQDHLRILSGMYGALRPLDAIHPYRLEMGRKLHTRRGEKLYDFWGDLIAKHLNDLQADEDEPVILNLASKEYFKAADRKSLKARVITANFSEEKDGQRRVLMVYAKKARGQMARWVMENRIEDPKDLKSFAVEGYEIDRARSTAGTLEFVRDQPELKSGPKKAA
tara:strand:+ start:5117 stop:5914 length:798 start_codon:yes stop_codon:yes gene_type:complete